MLNNLSYNYITMTWILVVFNVVGQKEAIPEPGSFQSACCQNTSWMGGEKVTTHELDLHLNKLPDIQAYSSFGESNQGNAKVLE